MKTPIYDFLSDYAARGGIRFHMPGHKGCGPLGIEHLDLTEVEGADVLSCASGIIAESEKNASALFNTGATLYTTEGSSTAVKAMLAVAAKRYRTKEKNTVLAARCAHRSFLHAAALLDLSVRFLLPESATHLYGGVPTASEVEAALREGKDRIFAVFITSPNYLGELADVGAIAAVCRRYSLPLLVDNAHGAYLAFLSPSRHPIHLGATMCADSAHKTLPVLTGGAYLHLSVEEKEALAEAREALALFSSSSPSYLQLASLDLCNHALENGFSYMLDAIIEAIDKAKLTLTSAGFTVQKSEPLKIVIADENAETLASLLRSAGIECEFSDRKHLVLMLSPHNTAAELDTLCAVLTPYGVHAIAPQTRAPLPLPADAVLSIREALFAPSERIPTTLAKGRICADAALSCPPAVPIAVCGERITSETVDALLYYGFDTVKVVKE